MINRIAKPIIDGVRSISFGQLKELPRMLPLAFLQATRWMVAGIIGGLSLKITMAPLPELQTMKLLLISLCTGTLMELILMQSPADDKLD